MEKITYLYRSLLHLNLMTQALVLSIVVATGVLHAITLKKGKIYGLASLLIQLPIGLLILSQMKYHIIVHLFIFILPSLLVGLVIYLFIVEIETENNPYKFDFYSKGFRKSINLLRGVIIFGAAGSGKTFTAFSRIIKHIIEAGLATLIYDHKNFELTEVYNNYYRQQELNYEKYLIELDDYKVKMAVDHGGKIKNFIKRFSIKKPKEVKKPLPSYQICFHNINYSNQCNPIAPELIADSEDLRVITKGFMSNLSSETGSDNQIFTSGAMAAMNGVIWRLKNDFPEHCNWAVAASILIQKNPDQLFAFIEKNRDAKILATPFFDARENDRLFSSFRNSISDAMVKIISPKTFYVLSGNDFNFKLNDLENPAHLLLINLPGKEDFYNPLHSMVFESVKTQISQQKGHPMAIILDEAGQIKFNKVYNIPALLRSFGIATVFGIQDKIQGVLLYSEDQLYSLLGNLSTKFFGKSNLPQTSKFYESYFELVKRKIFSKTDSNSSSGTGKSITISEKEEAKHRAFEFERLEEGEFHVFDEKGRHDFRKWDAPVGHGTLPSKKINKVTETELGILYNKILDLGLSLQ